MRKAFCLLVTIAGLFIALPLLPAQGVTSPPKLHLLQNKDIRLAESDSHGAEIRSSQYTASSLSHAQDYVSQSLPAPHPLATVPDGTLVTYKAFDGTVYSLQQYTGKYTAILMKPEDVAIYTIPQLRELLDQCDRLYTYYKELIPTEPTGGDITTIAFVKNCGYGCGHIGSKGIEIDPLAVRPEDIPPYPIIIHEMAHNFDQYSRAVMIGSDPPHAWTAFWEPFMAFYSNGAIDPDAAFKAFIDATLNTYLKDPSATWESCVENDACQPTLYSNNLQATALLRVVQLIGPAIVTTWLKRVDEVSRKLDFSGMTPTDKNDVLVETLSHAVNANFACYSDYLRWPVSDRLRAKLQSQYQDSAVCQDRDNDGFSPLQGDCDDSNPMVAPGTREVVNGVDDDCNRVIDDLLYSEVEDFPNTTSQAFQLSVPCRVRGTISSQTDQDQFQINFPTETKILFSPKATGDFSGWIYYYQPGSSDIKTFSYLAKDSTYDAPLTVPAGSWNFAFTVASPSGFGNYPTKPGQYEISIKIPDAETVLPVIPPVHTKHFGDYILTAPPVPVTLSNRSNVSARFWVSNVGWVGSVQASRSSETSFEWVAPAGTVPGTIWYCVQYYDGSLPLTAVTAPAFIDLTYDPVSGPIISSAAFDGRKTVTITGVRFGSTPEVIINYVDRSSTIKVASDGSITLTAKAKKLGLKAGDNTVQVINQAGVASPPFVVRL